MNLGYFDGLTSNLVRTGGDGRSYYAPAGKRGPLYLVPDPATAARIRREWKLFFIAFFAAMPVSILAVGPAWFGGAAWQVLGVPAFLGGVVGVVFGFIVARGLPRASISFAELPPMSRADAQATVGKAMGRTLIRVLFGVALFMTILGALAAILAPTLTLWLGAAFFGYCSFVLYKTLRRTP